MRSGNTVDRRNPVLSLCTAKIVQWLQPPKAEARAGFTERCLAVMGLSSTALYTHSEVHGTLRLTKIMVCLKILYVFINGHKEL